MSTPSDRLILFTRYPEAGTTKTRLIPMLGPEGAAAFQRRLTEQAARAAAEARRQRGVALEARYEGGDAAQVKAWLGAEFSCRAQGGGDIGTRMQACLAAAFAEGAQRAVLMGSDIPALTAAIVAEAFDALGHHDLVFGPAADGGYYLIGATAACLRRSTAFLDQGIPWGSPGVLARTLERARAAHLSCARLQTLADVDAPEDMPAAMRTLGCGAGRQQIAVVIPTLNEAGQLPHTLANLACSSGAEVIVVDGGSTDATVAAARAAGVRVLEAGAPRSIQMNSGAALASSELLLFLHADTRLPADFAAQARRTLASPRVAAGAFRLRIDADGLGLRLIERVANWRSRLLQLPYGDQAIFLRSGVFWEAGGFPPIPIMEDFELMRRLKSRGRIALAAGSARTSARRWQRLGLIRTWLINQLMVAAYRAGIPPGRLAAWYRGHKA